MVSDTTHVIVNPTAGAGRARKLLPVILKEARRLFGWRWSLCLTRHSGEATVSARWAVNRGADLVIAVGGDGTIQEAVNGFFKDGAAINPSCELGIVDCGTGHGLAQSLHLPSRLEDQLEVIRLSPGRSIDLGLVTVKGRDGSSTARLFVSECQIGIGGDVVASVGKLHKQLGGAVAFGSVTLGKVLSYRACAMSAEFRSGTRIAGRYMGLTIGNGPYCGGGMRLLPDAEVDDGELDVLLLSDMCFGERLVTFPRVYVGRHVNSARCVVQRDSGVTIHSARPVTVAADGELLGTTPCSVEVLPGAVRVRYPGYH